MGRKDKLSDETRKKIFFEDIQSNYTKTFTGNSFDLSQNSPLHQDQINDALLSKIFVDLDNLWAVKKNLAYKDFFNVKLANYAYHRTKKFREYELEYRKNFLNGLINDYELMKGKLSSNLKKQLVKKLAK